jgi:hypothetical protein
MNLMVKTSTASRDAALSTAKVQEHRLPACFAVREAVGIFHRSENLQAAIDELLSSGFHRAELSLLAGESAVEEKLGQRYEKVSELADDPVVPRSAYVSTEAIGGAEGGLIGGLVYVGAVVAAGAVVASGGTLTAAVVAAGLAGGTGGLIGSVLAKWVGDHHAHYLREQIDRGGQLLWVRTWSTEDEERAIDILKKHSGSEVHAHGLPAGAWPPTHDDSQPMMRSSRALNHRADCDTPEGE